jgi:hypothetical protein
MSGLLRSLAAQALNLPPTLRPAARLRAGVASVASEVAQEHEFTIAPKPVAAERSAFEPLPDRTSAALPVPAPPAIDSTIADREEPRAQRATDRALATHAVPHDTAARAMPPAPAHPETNDALFVDTPAHTATRRIASQEAEPAKVSEPAARIVRTSQQRLRSREMPARFEVSARAREPNAREPAAPDVHIHINRVELTALAAPAPSRRPSAAQANKPMSLDQYLQQRKRKTP